MPVDVETQLRQLGTALARESAPIAADEVMRPFVERGELDGDVVAVRGGGYRRARRGGRLLAAVGVALVVIGGLAVAVDRVQEGGSTDSPGERVPAPSAPPGALVLDPLPGGWTLQRATSNPWRSDGEVVTVYAAQPGRGDQSATVFIQTVDADLGEPSMTGTVTDVDVAGVTGHLHDSAFGRALSFQRDGSWTTLTSQRYGDSALLAMAQATTTADDRSTVIASDALPSELVERRTGHLFEAWWIDDAATGQVAPQANWISGERSFWYMSVADPDGAVPLRARGTIFAETTVWGAEAIVSGYDPAGSYRSVAWPSDGRMYLVGSRGLSTDELVAMANLLRPATDDEWQAILDGFEPEPATVSPETGLPEPGTVIPTGVAQFPVLDLDRATSVRQIHASYSYYPSGITTPGRSFAGVVGIDHPEGPTNLITIYVSDPASPEQRPTPAEPGRIAGVSETLYNNGSAALFTIADGRHVTLFNTPGDLDTMYAVIELIEPVVEDGTLAGYRFAGDLPAALSELEPPFSQGWDTGAFPQLSIDTGISISVNPAPALTIAAARPGNLERATIGGRPGYVNADPDNGAVVEIAVELDDGTTLHVTTAGTTRDELMTLVEAIDLVDEQTWLRTYPAEPAIVHPPPASTVPLATAVLSTEP
jgi:hypothetical protein